MNTDWVNFAEFVIQSHSALHRLQDTKRKHPADALETYFTANGENYRIRIERIPKTCEQKPVKYSN